MSTIRTHSGLMVDLLNPDPDTICIDDIAWHLSHINRYTGATERPYSVLEHSINVWRCSPNEHGLVALMHDTPEAYLGDVVSPLKKIIANLYKPMEENFWRVIAGKFGMPLEIPQAVDWVDKRMRLNEQRDLMGCAPVIDGRFPPIQDLTIPKMSLSSRLQMRRDFVKIFKKYQVGNS